MPLCFDWLLQHSTATADGSSTPEHAVPRSLESNTSKVAGLPKLLQPQRTHPNPKAAATTSISTSTVDSRTSWEETRQEASPANKLHFKTVTDLNSGALAAELSWHVRLEQQPARLAVKLSNRHKTRVTFEAQVSLRSSALLKLAGSPQGIHSAALLIKPLRAGSSSGTHGEDLPTAVADRQQVQPVRPYSHSRSGASGVNQRNTAMQSPASSSSGNSLGTAGLQAPSPALGLDSSVMPAPQASSTAATTSTSPALSRQRRRRQRQQQSVANKQTHTADSFQLSTTASLITEQAAAATQGAPSPVISQGAGPQAASNSMAAPLAINLQVTGPSQHTRRVPQQPEVPAGMGGSSAGAAAGLSQLHWEVGWNWKAGGPVAAVSRQLDPTTSSSGSGAGLLAVQQFKAVYDVKAHSYTLTAGGAGWNVTVAIPTHAKGFAGLVPRVWTRGCRPKITLSLVPELTCF